MGELLKKVEALNQNPTIGNIIGILEMMAKEIEAKKEAKPEAKKKKK